MSNKILFETNNGNNLDKYSVLSNINKDISTIDIYFKLNYKYDDEIKKYYKIIKMGEWILILIILRKISIMWF